MQIGELRELFLAHPECFASFPKVCGEYASS
jgi:hypothetical protein